MDSSEDEIYPTDEIDDNIRPPDKVIRERLIDIEDTRNNFEKEMDKALYMSIEEYKKQEELYDKYEEYLKNEYFNEVKKRRENFEGFLFDLNKLMKYDKEIKEIFDIIEPIIESYCFQYSENFHLDKLTYDKIFTTLNKTRTNKKSLELLKTIIIID